MVSFVAVTMLSLFTFCFGTYAAERVEHRRCEAYGQRLDPPQRGPEQ